MVQGQGADHQVERGVGERDADHVAFAEGNLAGQPGSDGEALGFGDHLI